MAFDVFTKEQIRWIIVALEDEIDSCNQSIEISDSMENFEQSEKIRQEIKACRDILGILRRMEESK